MPAARWISSKTLSGCETIEAWLESFTVTVVAFMRVANVCWSDGKISWSAPEIRYHDGTLFHATAVVGSLRRFTLPGFWTVAMTDAWRGSTSAQNDSRNFCLSKKTKVPKLLG